MVPKRKTTRSVKVIHKQLALSLFWYYINYMDSTVLIQQQERNMANLFNILDGINSSDFAEETLASIDDIETYAEAMGEKISRAEAERIQAAGKKWRDDQVNGNGEWSRMRHEAQAALES